MNRSLIFISCFLMVLVEGFDSQIMALAVPPMATAWHRMPSAFAVVFSVTAIGTGFGAPVVGVAADRIGRKWVLVLSGLLMGLLTATIAATSSITMLCVLRLFSGVCIGGTLVTALAIAGDQSAQQNRVRNTMLVYTGSAVGAITGSLLGGYLFRFGDWRLIFYAAGALTLIAVILPLALYHQEKTRPAVTHSAIPRGDSGAQASLFSQKYYARTLSLCAAQIAALTAAYLLTSWLPTIIANATGSVAQASLFNSLIYVGAIIGVFLMASIVVRVGAIRLLASVFSLAALIAVVVHFNVREHGPVLVVALLGLGTVMLGGQMVLSTLGTTLFPVELRASGIGLATGVGRVGALLGPATGGLMLASPALKDNVFLVLCAIIMATVCVVLVMGHVTRNDEAETA